METLHIETWRRKSRFYNDRPKKLQKLPEEASKRGREDKLQPGRYSVNKNAILVQSGQGSQKSTSISILLV